MRMVGTDLDGTVVRPDGTISARTLAAFEACERAGVDVVFVTGRPPRWLGSVVEQTGHRGTALCANGALAYDLAEDRVLHARTMTPQAVRDVHSRLSDAVPGGYFALETLTGFRREAAYLARWADETAMLRDRFDDLLIDGPQVVKLLCRHGTTSGDDLLAVARQVLDGVAEPTHSNSADTLLEVSAAGVSKAAGLAELAAERGIDQADVVAFGDMPNDLGMLAWAGRGYAMADGHAEAIAAAAHLAPPCAEDGVAQILEGLLAG